MNRALVHHDGETEACVLFRFGHHKLRRLIDAVIRSVPVDYNSIDSATDHVGNLAMDLRGIRGTVADVHVVRASEPQQQVRIHLRGGAGIK